MAKTKAPPLDTDAIKALVKDNLKSGYTETEIRRAFERALDEARRSASV